MKDDFFKNIPLDNSMSTQARYDIFTSKLNNGYENHNRKLHYNSNSTSLLIAIIQLISSMILVLFLGFGWIIKKLIK